MRKFSRIIFDIETDGLLPEHVEPPFCMTRIHCLVIKCIDSGEILEFVNNDEKNNLLDGITIIEDADFIVGHNILDFDLRAIELIFPDFHTDAKILDTLVMVRMVFADQKKKDFRLFAAGKLPGALIGRHGLESWGFRLGLHKGDYTKQCKEDLIRIHRENDLEAPTKEEIHTHTWGSWNPDMHAYCINDVEVNYLLFVRVEAADWDEFSTSFEHRIHLLMIQQETNGFMLDVPGTKRLRDSLTIEYDRLSEDAIAQIGVWYKPTKISKEDPRSEYGEDAARRSWGEIATPKRNQNFSKSNAKFLAENDFRKLRANKVEGCAYVPVTYKEFNPNSRVQIIDRLKTLYEWEPQDFTEKGNPEVNDEVLRNLAEYIPLAATLAESFYMKKRLGMVSDGPNGWLRLVRPDGRIHGHINVGGTVSGRATHSSPNISQVPGVVPIEFSSDEKKGITRDDAHASGLACIERHKIAGTYVYSKWKERKEEWAIYVLGREGNHGWDCRELFIAPEGYKLVGCDLSGIEFRCLANLTFPFDDGAIMDIVLNGDIHQANADVMGVGRGIAKRLLYACMYGGGDAKLGYIVEPLSSEARQKTLGKQLRASLMAAMPSLKEAIKAIKKEKQRNFGSIRGMDGRRLFVRSDHSALNLRLQSDGALIAKKWCLLVDDMMYDEGWEHGNGLDYSFCAWSHDEIQLAVRAELAERAAEITEAAAPIAGEFFNFNCPVVAESKININWAWTH